MEDTTGESEHAELIGRLRAIGQEPLDPGVAARALRRASAPRRAWLQSARIKVAAAAAGGFLVGSVGLASAGSLPSPAQRAAHSVLGTVGINVPPGQDRYNDPTACPGGPYRNHGQYVRSHKNDPNAGQSPCGKPTQAVNHPQGADDQEPPEPPDTQDGQGNGPPPWAHGRGKGKKGGGDDQTQTAPAAPAPAAPQVTTPTTAAPTTTTPPTTAGPTTTTSSTSTSTSTASTASTASTTSTTTSTTLAAEQSTSTSGNPTGP